MEADHTKDLYRIENKDGILNSWYGRNQFSACTECTVNIADIPSVNISLRECAGKASLFGGQGYRRFNCKTSCRSNLCSCRKSNKLYATLNVTIVHRVKINDICFDIIVLYISFVFLLFLLLADVIKNYFSLFPCIRFWSTCKQLFVFLFSIY